MKSHFAMFAAYNRWANERLYAAAGKLADADYRADRGAFFGSVHGTLNHLVVTDRIWMDRFEDKPPAAVTLNAILYDDLPGLWEARRAEDRRIVGYVDRLDEAGLAGTFSYRRVTTPEVFTQPIAPALAHFFNHQAHHRGQAHALLTAIGGKSAAPEMDLLYFQRESGIGMS